MKPEKARWFLLMKGTIISIPKKGGTSLLPNNYLPDTAWVFNEKIPQYKVKGWSQGAFKQYGKGRIVVFGEAAMFSAQLAGANQRKVGMNSEDAPENFQLLLNIFHWLDGGIE